MTRDNHTAAPGAAGASERAEDWLLRALPVGFAWAAGPFVGLGNWEAAAAAAALVAGLMLFYWGGLTVLGATGWRSVRSLLPYLSDAARENGFYVTYGVGGDEVAGVYLGPPEECVEALLARGAIHQPLAAHKTGPNGEPEAGSVAFVHGWPRERLESLPPAARFAVMALVARRQTHVTVFPAGDGDTVVTAHDEYQPFNALLALDHYRGVGLDPSTGKNAVRRALRDHGRFVASEEPDPGAAVEGDDDPPAGRRGDAG